MKPKIPKEILRLGTRASLLALRQANLVKTQIEEKNPEVEITLVDIKTQGDTLDIPLFKVGGKGLFVKEIEEALRCGEVDLAVHSAKDLPALIPEELALLAFPEREDPRDVWISRDGRKWLEIPERGRVGTGSLRRQAQLLSLRPDLDIVPLRGNLDTRIKKITPLDLQGIVLAAAGLRRMGWEDRVTEYFPPEVLLPAIGQGALAIEGRREDERVRRIVGPLNHPLTFAAIAAERGFLKRLGGGCQVPIAGLACIESGIIHLRALVASPDGKKIIRGEIRGKEHEGERLGKALAEELLGKGAEEVLREVDNQR